MEGSIMNVGPSGTDTFIVTVVIITAVVKQICKVPLHNLTTVIFSFLTLNQLVCECVLSLRKLLWSLQS